MNRIYTFLLICLIPGLFACNQTSSIKSTNSLTSLDSLIYKNYTYAIKNKSTFQYFLVVKVKNLNTSLIREICTKGDFLTGALHIENKIGYDSLGILKIENIEKNNKKRFFEFKDTMALNNLEINTYSIEDLNNFERTHNIDSLVQIITKGKWGLYIPDDKEMKLYAHSLFNRGILTGESNCYGGTLKHVEEKLIIERNNRDSIWNIRMNSLRKK